MMGLGPLVCPACMVYAKLKRDNDGPGEWVCPSCGTDSLDYLWMFSPAEQQTIAVNSKFIRFVQGAE